MKQILFTLLFILNYSYLCFAQTSFQIKFGSSQADAGSSVQHTMDGGYIVAGYATDFIGGSKKDVYLAKFTNTGVVQWSKTYGGTNDDEATCIKQTADSGYIIAGNSKYNFANVNYYTGFLIKTNALGDTLWTKTFADINFGISSVSQTTGGGYILSGASATPFGDGSAYLIRIDASGNVFWIKKYDPLLMSTPRAAVINTVIQTRDGGYLAGGYFAKSNNQPMFLIKTNSAGDTVWSRSYTQGAITAVKQTTAGDYILAGITSNGGGYFARINSSGNILWSKSYGSGLLGGNSVLQTNSGDFIQLISAMPFTSPDAAYLLKVNTNGNFLWCKKYGGGSNTTTGLGIQQTNDGGFVIAGQITDSGAQDVLLIKTDSSGISNCNEAPFVMSATNIGTNSSIAFTVGTGSSFTGSFPCYVNTVTTSSTTLCNNVGVTEQAESDKVTVYPNPSTGEFNIDLTAENALISIFDICGKPVVFKQVAPMKNSFSISQIGIYTVLVTSNKGVSTQRLIITR